MNILAQCYISRSRSRKRLFCKHDSWWKKVNAHWDFVIYRPNEKQLLPHLTESDDFKSIINSAQPIWHKSITSFSSLREDVFSDLQNIDKVSEKEFNWFELHFVILGWWSKMEKISNVKQNIERASQRWINCNNRTHRMW